MGEQTDNIERLLSLEDFHRLKFERIIPIYEVGVEKKYISYWRREGLLTFIEKGRWGRISCVDAMWLMILDALRRFGVGTTTMKRLNDYFFQRAHDDDVPRRNLLKNKAILEKRKAACAITNEDQQLLDTINEQLQNEILLYAFRWDINYFSNLITYSINTKTEAAILIFHDEQIVEQVFGLHNTFPVKPVNFSAPHIKLSLTYFLKTFIASEGLEEFLMITQLFNDREKEVLRAIRNKKIDEIIIEMSNGEIRRIESSRNGQITGEQVNEIRRVLGLKNYERVQIDVRNEKTLSFRRTFKSIK